MSDFKVLSFAEMAEIAAEAYEIDVNDINDEQIQLYIDAQEHEGNIVEHGDGWVIL